MGRIGIIGCCFFLCVGNVPASAAELILKGKASFYGRHDSGGKVTAQGRRYDPNGMTTAHRSLPFGTVLRITRGKRCAVVTVNDRGPYKRGRILDLSVAAAKAVGITHIGVGHVTAEIVDAKTSCLT